MSTEKYTCGKCGARVGNSKTHARWHDQLNDRSGADPEAAVSGDSAASESVESTLTYDPTLEALHNTTHYLESVRFTSPSHYAAWQRARAVLGLPEVSEEADWQNRPSDSAETPLSRLEAVSKLGDDIGLVELYDRGYVVARRSGCLRCGRSHLYADDICRDGLPKPSVTERGTSGGGQR